MSSNVKEVMHGFYDTHDDISWHFGLWATSAHPGPSAKAPLLWQKTNHPIAIASTLCCLCLTDWSGEWCTLSRRLRLRYIHQLSHLSATDDPQYAQVPTREIKLPDTRLHHFCTQVRKMQRAFNHAAHSPPHPTPPPCLVKSQWPLMTSHQHEET